MKAQNEPVAVALENWNLVDWGFLESGVLKMQQQLYRAEKEGDRKKSRGIQRILLLSKSNLLLSIHNVCDVKRKGVVNVPLTSKEKTSLFSRMLDENINSYIPKDLSCGNKIVSARDYIYQLICRSALEPAWEARFDSTSYAWRPGRNKMDAIARVFTSLSKGKKQWVVRCDCAPNIRDDFLLDKLKGFPGKKYVSGFLEKNRLICNLEYLNENDSMLLPLLVNILMDGLEEELGIVFRKRTMKSGNEIWENRNSHFSVSRFGLQIAVMCDSEDYSRKARDILEKYVARRFYSDASISILNLISGFEFADSEIRWSESRVKSKLICRPSKNKIAECRREIKKIFSDCRGDNTSILIPRLNKVILDFTTRFSNLVSKEIFSSLDNYTWILTKLFLRRTHPMKNWDWIIKRYFSPDKYGVSKNRWILTDPEKGYQLSRFAQVRIVRHPLITHDFSPFDKSLEFYFLSREIIMFSRMFPDFVFRIARKQNFTCPVCNRKMDVRTKVSLVTDKENSNSKILVHLHCKRKIK